MKWLRRTNSRLTIESMACLARDAMNEYLQRHRPPGRRGSANKSGSVIQNCPEDVARPKKGSLRYQIESMPRAQRRLSPTRHQKSASHANCLGSSRWVGRIRTMCSMLAMTKDSLYPALRRAVSGRSACYSNVFRQGLFSTLKQALGAL